ncbi:prefoldin subunit beta [Candidatus Woesearchaeota archaeon]|nr:prefoldin subunit beta [Candidatus Woesearchaeota archaeon]
MDKDTEKKLGQLQMIEQNLQGMLVQKQQFQTQLIEIESALKELETAKESYKIIGNIMVSSNKEDLKKDLQGKKERAELRIKTVEKQEKSLREKAGGMQSEIVKELKPKK